MLRPDPNHFFWDPTCDDIIGRVDTTYTITVEVDDGCDTAQDSFDVTLYAEPCEECIVELRSSTTACTGVGKGITLPIPKPSGVAEGDFLLAQVSLEKGSDVTIIPPSGWTLVVRTDYLSNFGQAIYYKFAGSLEPSSYTWEFYKSDNPDEELEIYAVGGILSFSCVDTTNPIIDSSEATYQDGFDMVAASVNAEADSMLVGFYALEEYQYTLLTTGGMTEEYQVHCGDYSTIMAATEFRTSSGSTGSRTSSIGVDDHWVAHLVAIRGK